MCGFIFFLQCFFLVLILPWKMKIWKITLHFQKRFERFNDVGRSFECIYKVLDLKESKLEQHCEKLAQANGLSFSELISQLRLFRSYMSAKKMTFKNFPEMAKLILTSTSYEALKHLHFLVSVSRYALYDRRLWEIIFCHEPYQEEQVQQAWWNS